MTRWLLALLAALCFAPAAQAVDEADLLPIDRAFALTAQATERGRIELHWDIADGYYLYRHRMGAEVLSPGFKANPLQLPDGIAYTDEFFGDVQTYRDEVTAVVTGAAADDTRWVELKIKYQGCADLGVCYPPHSKILRIALPFGTGMPAGGPVELLAPRGSDLLGGPGSTLPLPEEDAFRFEAIVGNANQLLLRFTPAPGYYLYRDRSSVEVRGDGVSAGAIAWPASTSHFDEHFGDLQVYFDQVEAPLPVLRQHTDAVAVTVVATFQGCQTDGICYPPMTREVALELPAGGMVSPVGGTSVPNGGDDASGLKSLPQGSSLSAIAIALLLALGGGVILNLMPCVLPVLSLKALSLAQGGGDRRQARSQALWYTAGVLASFAAVGAIALALRQAGLALGWGFQLQQPGVIAVLALVMVAIGLSLSGVVNFGASLAGTGQSLAQKSGPAGDFFTGVLAVVVASPCTAPFMGSALAFAFAASPAVAIGVFLALGLGLALPFLLIGFVPALASRLPKPGAWMETFKHLMAFPMYLTAVWLLWVLAKQRGADAIGLALVGAVGLGLGLWLWEKARFKGVVAKTLAALVIALSLWPAIAVQRMPAPARAESIVEGVVEYSAERLQQLRRDGRVVFVNMTADWCVSCKANERSVLGTDSFREALERSGAIYMVGDWTNVDPEITAFLETHNAVGVPLYVVYPRQGEPRVLPIILTQALVDEALAEAAR
ncbi:protein-disulfide reductase DsbD family protein [Arenimonas donghaensis]|uniref:Thioredoxin domain-containing protein n=1 Tax=Arenimonas donghaensis DSM 18148 = HO3-R19 TaxID=1121014 RepID=A0A087MKB7_9GAMM|nr:protein-disulfide reductase DsbD [Arenimonas donghaensis]KFL37320.1 hypothetical protein N788_09990 [Arenimonas donghaensis DSM 18148 = HO3-R19]